ncbi:hypothetical protein ACWF82_07675 [Nocardia sp. NPDC055053]
MDLPSIAIVLATCVFFLFGLSVLTESLLFAAAGSLGLAAAMVIATRVTI